MKTSRLGIWYLTSKLSGKSGFQEFVQRKFHVGLFQLVGGWAISQLIPNKYACQLGFKQNNRRTWWSINEENKTTNIVTVPWNRLHDQTARITHITNEYAQTSGDGWVDQQCRRANGALSNKNDHQQFLMLFEHHLRSYQGREEATKSNNRWHDGFLGTGHGRETTAQQDHHGAIVLPILAVDRVSFELQWISRKIECLSNLSFPIIHPQNMIKLKDHFQRENGDKPQSKDGSERHRSRTAGSNQSASPGNGQRWRQRSSGPDGPGRARSWWEEGHYSYSSDSSIMFNHVQGLQGAGDCARPHFSVISARSSQQLKTILCSAKRQIPSKNKVFVQVTRPL